LVCGEFLQSTTNQLLSWLSIALEYLPSNYLLYFKPHPANLNRIKNFHKLNLKTTNDPCSELFNHCDVVFLGNATSVSVEALYFNIPLIQVFDNKTLNMSPLRGMGNVQYVSNPMELAQALLNFKSNEQDKIIRYFYLDNQLPRWKILLDNKQNRGIVK